MSDHDLSIAISIWGCAFWLWIAIVVYEYRNEIADFIIERCGLGPK